MRSLKYTVVALTPLLGAGGFAQGLNLGMNDGFMLQAQAPAQTESTGSYGAINGGGRPEPDRESGADRAPTRVSGKVRPDVGSPMAVDFKGSPRAHAKTQTRKVGKKSKDTVAN